MPAMQYTTQQKQEFRDEFKRRQKRQYLIGLPVLGLIILKIVYRSSGQGSGLPRWSLRDGKV